MRRSHLLSMFAVAPALLAPPLTPSATGQEIPGPCDESFESCYSMTCTPNEGDIVPTTCDPNSNFVFSDSVEYRKVVRFQSTGYPGSSARIAPGGVLCDNGTEQTYSNSCGRILVAAREGAGCSIVASSYGSIGVNVCIAGQD